MPGTSNILFFVVTTTLHYRYYDPHFMYVKTEAYGGEEIC